MSSPQELAPASSGRIAAKGMAWSAVALGFSRLLSFFSQIALGHLLAVETYAVFALVATTMIFVAGFQNSGVAKAMIQQHERLDELLPEYSAFAIRTGLAGCVLLIGLGAILQNFYEAPGLFQILLLHSVSIPLISLTTILTGVLSIQLAFRSINVVEIKRSLIYYAVLVCGAALGTEGYTMALAVLVASMAQLAMLLRVAPVKVRVRLSVARFRALAWQLRWVISSAFLVTLGMNGDYLVLGKLLEPDELGYYFFGFILIANVTVLLAATANQTLLPVFSRLKDDLPALQRQLLLSSGAITLLACILSIGLVGLGAVVVHLIWGGKWDGAIVVVLSIATIQPIRLTATVGGVLLEAQAAWAVRLATLIFDAALILVCAFLGGWLGGLSGAAIAVAIQRALSGLVAFPLGARRIGIDGRSIGRFWFRCFGPYMATIGALFLVAPSRYSEADSLAVVLRAAMETGGALAVFLVANWAFNRDLLLAIAALIRDRKG